MTATQAGTLRRLNLVGEYTQALIALTIVVTTCGGIILSRAHDAFPPEWWTIVGLVIGFYFGRVPHRARGDLP